jgi:hypothetical protein
MISQLWIDEADRRYMEYKSGKITASVEPDEIIIQATMHLRKRPDCWIGR